VSEADWAEEESRAVVKALADRRQALGLSIYEVSNRSGLPQNLISYYERGLRRPSLYSLIKLADGLEVKLSVVFAGVEKASRKPRR